MLELAPQFTATHGPGYEPLSVAEVFALISCIRDPEHPSMTLGELKVVEAAGIEVDDAGNYVRVVYVPTTPNCSMGNILGLSVRVKLMRCLPLRFTVDVLCKEGAHDSWEELNKQLNDKERVLAALNNPHIFRLIHQMIRAD